MTWPFYPFQNVTHILLRPQSSALIKLPTTLRQGENEFLFDRVEKQEPAFSIHNIECTEVNVGMATARVWGGFCLMFVSSKPDPPYDRLLVHDTKPAPVWAGI